MSSTLDPDDVGHPGPGQHGSESSTGSLGPSDSSDSGSDVAGAMRHEFDVDTGLDNHALESGALGSESDPDRTGSGERASADGDANFEPDAGIEPDRIDDAFEDGDRTEGG